jgi:hypothetical protein
MGHIMRAHRRNAKNKRAHVNGLKKAHDEDHAEEISGDHGKDHGEQARKGGGTNRVAPRRACRPQAHGKETGKKKNARLQPRRRGAASREIPLRPPRTSSRS